MGTITRTMIINDVIRKHPQTVKVFNDFKVDACCGGGAAIETTAKRDGVDVETLVTALNDVVRAADGACGHCGDPADRKI